MIADDQKVEVSGAEAILIYKDYLNANTYYYSSTRPSIGRQSGDFAFSLLRYDQPKDDQAGTLSFAVDLEPGDSEMEVAYRVLGKDNLKPMPWTSGLVTANVIGGDPVCATPSLIGRNSAVVTIPLKTDQYIQLQQSMNNGQQPISVVYKLSYDAFRKAYEARIDFDETKFREWLQTKCQLDLLVVSFESTETFEELQSSQVIKISTVDTTGSREMQGLQRAFMRSLQSVFTPVPFARPREAGGPGFGFSCSSVHDIQNIGRRLDCDMQVSSAVTRSLFIQGAVSNFAEAYRKCPAEVIPREGRFKQHVVFRCHTAFDGRPVKRVQLSVLGKKYSSQYNFDSVCPQEWGQELTYDPGPVDSGGAKYSYRAQVFFAEPWKQPASSPTPISRDKDFVDIIPADLYTYRRFGVSTATDFPWQLISSIKVTLRMSGTPESGPLYLSSDRPTGELEFFAPRLVDLEDLEFRALYTPVGKASFEQAGLPAGNTIFLDPFRPSDFRVRVAESFDWARYKQIRVSIELPQGVLGDTQTVVLTKDSTPPTWNLWSREPGTPRITYRTAFTASQGPSPPARKDTIAVGRVVTIDTPV